MYKLLKIRGFVALPIIIGSAILAVGVLGGLAYEYKNNQSILSVVNKNKMLADASGVTTPTITVISPNGGENWTIGTVQNISWKDTTVTFAPSTYYITAIPLSSNAAPFLFAKNITGSLYSWKVSDKTGGGRYIIKVCQTDSTICDSSDNYFTIVSQLPCISEGAGIPVTPIGLTQQCCSGLILCPPPANIVGSRGSCRKSCTSIKVLSPNGGETLKTGETYDITWESTGMDKINIYLQTFPAQDGLTMGTGNIATNVSASVGKYSWTIPYSIESDYGVGQDTIGVNRQIVISDVGGKNILDGSDKPITIVRGKTCSEKCQSLGYESKICKGFGTHLEGMEQFEEFSKTHTLIGGTSDCYTPANLLGIGTNCWCSGCTTEYPVCAQPPMPKCPEGMECIQVMPVPKTYSNECMAKKDNATVLYKGECGKTTICDATSKAIVDSVGGCTKIDKSLYSNVYQACCVKVTKELLLSMLNDYLSDGVISDSEKTALLTALNSYLQ